MKLPNRAIHLDFHTMPAVPDVGADFDPGQFAATLADARVDYVTVFAKCNLGMAYYPTRVGVRHPSLRRDLLGEMVESCHRREIAVAAYLNAGLDHEMGRLHRDWVTLDREGHAHGPDCLDHFFRVMCFGGPWADHLAGMIDEVLTGYDVDGLFLDCWAWNCACYGDECVGPIRDRGLDVLDHATVVEAQNQRKLDFIARVRAMIDQKRPGIAYYLNGIPFNRQATVASHLDLESLPSGGWGYMDFPWKVRYVRRMVPRVVRLTGRFHRGWAEFGGLRTQAGLDFDCFQAISHGATCGIGDHMHPRGRLDAAAYERIGSIFGRIEALEPWTRDAKGITEVAVVSPDLRCPTVEPGREDRSLWAATRALEELRQQFDILDEADDWTGYRTAVLLDPLRLDRAGLDRLRRHVAAGGTVLACGSAGLLSDRDEFPDEWGLDYVGPETLNPHYLTVRKALGAALPDMPLLVEAPGARVRARDGTEVLAEVVAPYFNRHWDGFHGHLYTPPDRASGFPAITRRGPVIHLAWSVLRDYARSANPVHREIIGAALRLLMPEPLVLAPGLPSFARVSLTGQGDRTMVHLLSYLPERRCGDLEIVEEPIALRDVMVSIRRPAARSVSLAPQGQAVSWSARGGRVEFVVPEVRGYQMVVIE